jgi:hypothetical protein
LRTRLEVKRIELFSLFKLAFYIYAVIGLIFAVVYGLFMLVVGGIQSVVFGGDAPNLGVVGIVLGIFAIPLIALVYGAVASVFITIGGWLYNLIAGGVGGLRLEAEVEEVYAEAQPRPAAEPAATPSPSPEAPGSITPPGGPTITRSPSLDDE